MQSTDSIKGFNAALDKAERLSHLNIFISLATPTIQSEGRLKGMLLAVKDNIHVKDLPNTVGTKALENFIPTEDAPAIARLKSEGASILGKANMHEMAFGITSNNACYGPVRNPYGINCFAGGSSGGSAAAVSARIVDAAIGSDTGASVRLPAALCGVIGFRPSLERYPMEGVTPVSKSRDVIGPIARDMKTITLLDSVLANRPQVVMASELSKVRLGVVRGTFYKNLHPETRRLMDDALIIMADAGVTLVEFAMDEVADLTEKVAGPLALYEAVRDLPQYLKETNVGIDFFKLAERIQSPDVKRLFLQMAENKNKDGSPAGIIPKEAYDAAIKQFQPSLKTAFARHFKEQNIDALVFPTTILPASLIDGSLETIEHNGQRLPTFPTYIQNTDPGSSVGMPGISLPIGLTSQGLPVGMELDALEGQDEHLLAIALALEPLFERLPLPQM